MKIEGGNQGGLEGWTSPFKAIGRKVAAGGRGVGRGIKKGGKLAYKGGKFAVKTNLRAWLLVNKLALKGLCAMPGPVRAAAVGAAITAGTGGAGGVAAPMVSEAAADAICKAMRSGKKSDQDAAQRALDQDGIAFAKPSIWDEILSALGIT
jgi:hypothetical protein